MTSHNVALIRTDDGVYLRRDDLVEAMLCMDEDVSPQCIAARIATLGLTPSEANADA